MGYSTSSEITGDHIHSHTHISSRGMLLIRKVNYSLRSFLVLPSTPTYVDGLFQASTCVIYSRIRTVLLLQSDGLTSNGRIVSSTIHPLPEGDGFLVYFLLKCEVKLSLVSVVTSLMKKQINGGLYRTRTDDNCVANAVLYQLS